MLSPGWGGFPWTQFLIYCVVKSKVGCFRASLKNPWYFARKSSFFHSTHRLEVFHLKKLTCIIRNVLYIFNKHSKLKGTLPWNLLFTICEKYFLSFKMKLKVHFIISMMRYMSWTSWNVTKLYFYLSRTIWNLLIWWKL